MKVRRRGRKERGREWEWRIKQTDMLSLCNEANKPYTAPQRQSRERYAKKYTIAAARPVKTSYLLSVLWGSARSLLL